VHSAVGIITMRNRTVSPLAELFMKCARQFVQMAPRPSKRVPA
jgi:hypothetical protein